MPVPVAITDLTAVAASNSPTGAENTFPSLDDYLRAHASFIKQNYDSLSAKASTSAPAFTGTATFGSASWSVDATYFRNGGNSQPMFHASATGAGNQTTGSTVSFTLEETDQGAVFDATTSVFTAPRAGVYDLRASVLVLNNHTGSISQELILTGSVVGAIDRCLHTIPSGGASFQYKLGAVVRLAAGETVTVQATQEVFAGTRTLVYKNWATKAAVFSGALLY